MRLSGSGPLQLRAVAEVCVAGESLICHQCGFRPAPGDGEVCPKDGRHLITTVEHLAARRDPHLGTVLGGRYPLLGLLGQGSMGAVYKSRQPPLDREVAIKVIHPAGGGMKRAMLEELEQRFLREAKLLAALDHQSVVTLYDFGAEENGTLYMVMEYLRGRPLHHVLQALGPRDLVGVIRQVLDALGLAHERGLVHRDIKPENVMVIDGRSTDDGTPVVKLLDFGIAKKLNEAQSVRLTAQGAVFGTPWYMSPEQASGNDDLDHRTDLYSMGVILYEGIAGRVPFDAPDPTSVLIQVVNKDPPPIDPRPDLPIGLLEIISRAMSKAPGSRHQTAREMSDALAGLAWTSEITSVDLRIRPPAPAAASSSVVEASSSSTALTEPALPELDLDPVDAGRFKTSKWRGLLLGLAVAGLAAGAAYGLKRMAQDVPESREVQRVRVGGGPLKLGAVSPSDAQPTTHTDVGVGAGAARSGVRRARRPRLRRARSPHRARRRARRRKVGEPEALSLPGL